MQDLFLDGQLILTALGQGGTPLLSGRQAEQLVVAFSQLHLCVCSDSLAVKEEEGEEEVEVELHEMEDQVVARRPRRRG